MSKEINIKNLSYEEWLKLRQSGIGGSDAGAICGINKYKSPYAIYLSKTEEIKEEEISQSAHFGNILEEVVAQEFTRVTGKKVRKKNVMIRSKENDFMLANLDRAIVGEKAFLECKTTSLYNEHLWKEDNIPETYMLQIQHYMYVCEFEKCYIACLIGGQKFVWKEIQRNEKLIDLLIKIEKDFWVNNVLKKEPPLLNGGEKDSKLINMLYPISNENEVALPYEARTKITELENLKERKKEIDEKIANCENYIKDYLKDSSIGVIDDCIVSWKTYETKRIDTKKLQEEELDIYNKYLKTNVSRRFTIKYINKE